MRSSWKTSVHLTILAAILSIAGSGMASAPASAAAGQTALITVHPATQTQPTGAAQTYRINISCAGTVGGACGPNTTITIPLDTGTTPAMTDPSWLYAATSGSAGLITSGPTVVGTNLVIGVDSLQFVSGYSGSITLTATPPNLVTPNKTSWSILPTITGGGIVPVVAPDAATSVATAAPKVSVSKATADGGSVYEIDGTITYTISAKCTTTSTGALWLTGSSLVDTLPADLTYVSSTPAGGVYDPATHMVRWAFSDANLATMPAGCSNGSTGTNTFTITTTAPATVPNPPLLTNKATYSGTGPDATDPSGLTSSATATVPVQIIAEPNVGPGPGYATVVKSSLAPIAQPGITSGNQYVSTFSGNWLPAQAPGIWSTNAAAAMYRTVVSYGLVGRYMTDLIDPLPCLDVVSNNLYSSAAITASACVHPAFHTQLIEVQSAGSDPTTNGLGQAYGAGWRPQAILPDGSTISLVATGSVSSAASTANFSIPAGADVATLRLPPDLALRNAKLRLTAWGYADGSLANVNEGLNQLRNTATAIPQITLGDPLATVRSAADIFTIPTKPQLGISKAFSAPGAGPGGTTVLSILGSAVTPGALTKDLMITDLLPLGMTWTNPVPSATFTVTPGGSKPSFTTSAAITVLNNYQGSGRQLIRIRINKSAVNAAGAWTFTPPTNLLLVSTPTALGIYPNSDQIFLYGSKYTDIQTTCGTPTQTGGGISTASFENDNSADLAGDGNLSEGYCENRASLSVKGTGAAFVLTKTVQGDLDSVERGALGVGQASPGGTGTFRLTWANVGSNTLANPVIYDVLPHVGDTGVSQGQSTVARESQFTPIFVALGSLPSGVSVAYSSSWNPCRPEVFADAANPSCVNDWTTTPPADLSEVRSLRFIATGSFAAGATFSTSFSVRVPGSDINQIAWNSSATNATDKTDPSNHPLPAEPPKVGIMAPVSPVIITSTSATLATAFGTLSDTVAISGTGGGPGVLNWSLFGPIEPLNNACDALSWSKAPLTASGSVAITGDGEVTVGPATLGEGGCYAWAESLTSTDPNRPYSAATGRGQANEMTIVTPYPPALHTIAEVTHGVSGTTMSDGIEISDIPVAAPTPGPLTWTLYGPLPWGTNRSCDGLDWTSAPTAASGTIAITGNSTVHSPPVTISTPGCYSFGDVLPATSASHAVTIDPGLPSETALIDELLITTTTSAATLLPGGSAHDGVDISGTSGGTGTIAWSALGPVKTVGSTCDTVDWTDAPVVASGTVDVAGDGTYVTPTVTFALPGCYTWVHTITGTFPSPTVTSPGAPNEVVQVTPHAPTIDTHAVLTPAGGHSIATDQITISGSGVGHGADVTSNVVRWALLGPAAPVAGSCAKVAWLGVATLRSGSVTFTGDGELTTKPTPVLDPGCYTYVEQMAGTITALPASTTPGTALETFEISSPSGGGGSSTGSGGLAFTGLDAARLLLGGAALVVSGLSLLLLRRRRRA